MAVDFKSSKTKENLMKAFAGESQARNRYTIAAETAEKQNMQAISSIFRFTAEQERAHAQRFYELLREMEGTTVEICGGYPVDTYESILELLKSAPFPADLKALDENGIRQIWHEAKLRGRGYSRSGEILVYARASVGIRDGADAARIAVQWFVKKVIERQKTEAR